MLESEYIRKEGETGKEDINEYNYTLTYKGLKFYIERRHHEESREKLDEVIKLHSGNSVALKYYDVFKTNGLDDYTVKRFHRRDHYNTSRGYLESIRYFNRPDNIVVDTVDVLGLDYLMMKKEKVKKMLGDDYEKQLNYLRYWGKYLSWAQFYGSTLTMLKIERSMY